MKSTIVSTLTCTLFATLGTAHAQQPFEQTTCRAGTMTVLAKAEKMIVWSLDHRGVTQSVDAGKLFDGATQRCIGTVANIDGRISASGWCRNVDLKTGDWNVIDWVGSDKPGHGTFSFRYGTGKWQGLSGGGTYEPAGQSRPVDDGTYQNCVRVKGTVKLPG